MSGVEPPMSVAHSWYATETPVYRTETGNASAREVARSA